MPSANRPKPDLFCHFGERCVQTCMRVVLCQRKNGLPGFSFTCCSRNRSLLSRKIISTSSMFSRPVQGQLSVAYRGDRAPPGGSQRHSAEAATDLAKATQFALELELELSFKRSEQESLLSTSATALTLNAISQTVRAIEGKCLEAQREETKKMEQLASREKRVIEQRLRLFDLQSEVLGVKR